MDQRLLKLAGLSSGPCAGYTVPAVLTVLGVQTHAATLQAWLQRVAYNFQPAKLGVPVKAEPAAAGVKRESNPAARAKREAAAGADAPARGQGVKRAEAARASQGGQAVIGIQSCASVWGFAEPHAWEQQPKHAATTSVPPAVVLRSVGRS